MPPEITEELKGVIRREADIIYADAWLNAPYDYDSRLVTPKWDKVGLAGGEKRKHIKDALKISITLKGLRARVGIVGPKDAAKYGLLAKWIHFGTRNTKKNPFLLDAFKHELPTARKRIGEAIRRAIDRASRLAADG